MFGSVSAIGKEPACRSVFFFHLFVERYLLGTCYNLMERIWNLLFSAKNLQSNFAFVCLVAKPLHRSEAFDELVFCGEETT